jgi:dTDP-glucose 4,6-dehydratase
MGGMLLITGGAGFIGSCFVRQALAAGYRVVVLDALTYAGHKENLDGLADMQLVVGSITDRALVDRLLSEHSPQAVVHFAAESHVDNSIASPGDFIDTNIVGTYTLLEACRAYAPGGDFRFIQVSTDEVFGSLGDNGYFTEASNYAPNSPYSASKAAGDHLARAWFHTYGLPVIVTHCSNNYGPRQLPEKLIPVIVTRALAGQALPVYGDGANIRDWIHVADHAQGIMLALAKGRPGEHYCFGGRQEMRNIELVTLICRQLDAMRPASQPYETLIRFVTDRPGHDRRYAIDDSKAEKELGFTRRYDFKTGIAETIEWYLANQAWCNAVSGKNAA